MTRVLNHFLIMKEVQAEINTLSVIHELVTGHMGWHAVNNYLLLKYGIPP